jgi:hypothetical protein
MMEAVRTSETSVDNYFTWQYIPEDNSELHTRRRENLEMSRRKVLSVVKVCLCSTLRQQQTRSAIAQAVSRRLLIAEVVGAQVIQRGIFFCGGQSGTGTGFS